MKYRHAIWPPSEKWREGFMLSAPLDAFTREFPKRVSELGPPLRVWDSEPLSQAVVDDAAQA